MDLIDKVSEVLFDKFRDKRDRGGRPYTEHLFRVAEEAEAIQVGAYLTGLLHDAIEDTDLTADDLYLLGVGSAVIDRVSVLTRLPHEGYELYVKRLKKYARRHKDKIVLAVKIADLTDNLNLGRLNSLQNSDWERVKRYMQTRQALIQMLATLNRKESKWEKSENRHKASNAKSA